MIWNSSSYSNLRDTHRLVSTAMALTDYGDWGYTLIRATGPWQPDWDNISDAPAPASGTLLKSHQVNVSGTRTFGLWLLHPHILGPTSSGTQLHAFSTSANKWTKAPAATADWWDHAAGAAPLQASGVMAWRLLPLLLDGTAKSRSAPGAAAYSANAGVAQSTPVFRFIWIPGLLSKSVGSDPTSAQDAYWNSGMSATRRRRMASGTSNGPLRAQSICGLLASPLTEAFTFRTSTNATAW